MDWDIDFISHDTFKSYVREVIVNYCQKLKSYDINEFNRNIIDPIKLIVDKYVYDDDWSQIIDNEIFRQRDKSTDNDIGYFHQNIFNHFKYCQVPEEGWDVIFRPPSGVTLPSGDKVSTIYAEVKNKHNTMNSASSQKIYISMQDQILEDDDCACFLVETIAKNTQNINWTISVNGKKCDHNRIRRVSMDHFYEIVTGDPNGFYKICKVLPSVIKEVMDDRGSIPVPEDSVVEQLEKICKDNGISFEMALYRLSFSDYNGF